MPLGELLDRSLWPYCSEEILRQEATLEELGWRELLAPPALEFASGANASAIVPIRRSRCRWTRMTLSGRTRGAPGGNPLNVAADILSMDLQHRRA